MTKTYLFLRNLAHPYIYLFLIYGMFVACKADSYTWDGRYIGMPIAALILNTWAGHVWEWCQKFFLKANYDVKDVYRSVAGGVVAVIAFIIDPHLFESYPILKWNVWAALALIVISILLGLRLMYKRKQLFQ